jgi:hypothetical protein
MSYKKSLPYFIFQSIKYAKNIQHFKTTWSYYHSWKSALVPGRNSVDDQQAWINFASLKFLETYLRRDNKVFEYGGGGSTLFFIKHAGFVATVENDQQWFQTLKERIESLSVNSWEGFFQEGEEVAPDPNRRTYQPEDYLSNMKGQENLNYEKYAKMICRYPAEYFDVVLVDGRARPSCIAESFPYLKKGGYLVVDNMERSYYHNVINHSYRNLMEVIIEGFYPTPYHPDFTNTMIFKKM